MDVINLIKKEGFRRNLSINTIKSYCYHTKKFLEYVNKEPRKITKKDVKNYLYKISEEGKSSNTLNLVLSSIKFMISEILFKTWKLDIKYAKKTKSLPVFLTKKQVNKLLHVIKNKKHWLMIAMLYSAGLRRSELINLKVKDLDIDSNYGWVRKGKGNKDRMFIIARRLKPQLKTTIDKLKYYDYLFTGNRGNHISKETLYKIVKRYSEKAGIKKNVHPHVLRHSFTTHMIESGYDITIVQRLLGHESVEATERYIHTAIPQRINVESPFDSLEVKA